jgi:hypothetical protein
MEGHVTGRYRPEVERRFAMANLVTGVVSQQHPSAASWTEATSDRRA